MGPASAPQWQAKILRKTEARTELAEAVRQVALAMAAWVAGAVVPLREPPVALAVAWAAAWVAAVGVTSAARAVALDAALAALRAP